MSFSLPDLPYAHDALAPHMSRETLEYHHDKHHLAYVNNGNNLLKGTEWENKSLEEVVKGSFGKNAGLFNNAGQHYNHLHFWKWMKPGGGGDKIPGALKTKIGGSTGLYDAVFAAVGGKPGFMDPKGRLIYSHNGSMFMVTKPINGEPATFANGGTIGFNFASASMLVARGCSSLSTTTASPLRWGISTATISAASRPLAWAAAAFSWLRSAKASWSSRLTWNSCATFSPVLGMVSSP